MLLEKSTERESVLSQAQILDDKLKKRNECATKPSSMKCSLLWCMDVLILTSVNYILTR